MHLAELEALKAPARRGDEGLNVADLIDTHAHLDDEQFAGDLPAVLERARAAGVVQIVAVATTATSSAACIALASNHPHVFATVGIHPNHAAEAAPTAWDEVVALAARREVVGIGETGLDRHWDDTPFPLQEDYFARHLELGRRTEQAGGDPLPRGRGRRAADAAGGLRPERPDPRRDALVRRRRRTWRRRAWRWGLYLSFAGMLTYKNAPALREVAAKQPLERLLVETDSPYLSPVPLRGKRNEPANVVHTAACLAGLHGLTPEALAERTTRNARALFGLQASRRA